MDSLNYDLCITTWVDVKLFALSIFPSREYILASVYGSNTKNNLTSIIIDNLVTIGQFCWNQITFHLSVTIYLFYCIA